MARENKERAVNMKGGGREDSQILLTVILDGTVSLTSLLLMASSISE